MSTAAPTTTPATDWDAMSANIRRTFAFNRAVIANPALLDEIPNGCVLVLLTGDAEDDETEIAMGLEEARRGRNVYILHWSPPEQQDGPSEGAANGNVTPTQPDRSPNG